MAVRNAQTHRRDELLRLLDPVVAEHGYDLEDVTVAAAGRRSVIRVVIDSDTGVDLDAVAEVARSVSDVLDTETAGVAVFAEAYVLEVSSPGTDRPLTEARHWRRAVGRLVSTTAHGTALRGRVVAADNAKVTFEVLGAPITVDVADLAPGRVEVEFNRPGNDELADDGEITEASADSLSHGKD